MNIVEVQDSLKNFSQDQLISEINQPSGMVPQFLVLTELGRRNRMKQDIEGRQAQNQPTVAQEVVSAAGVPQGGIMDMARSMAPKSSIEQNDAVKMMDEGGKVDRPRNRFEAMLEYLRSLGADSDEEIEQATGKSLAEIINFGGDYRPVKKADGGIVKMQQGTVVYKGKTYFTDGNYVAEKGESGRIVPVNDPEIVEAVTKKSPSATTEIGGIGDVSTNLDTFNPVSSGITSVNTPDPMFTLGNQMPSIASVDDQPNKFTDLPQMPLVKDKDFTLKPYEGPNIGAFDATGTGSSENMDTVLNIPELTDDTPIESPDLKTIFEGAAIQYPNQGENPLDMESIAGSRRSTSGLPSIEAMENIGKLRSEQLKNKDTTDNIPEFTSEVPVDRSKPDMLSARNSNLEALGDTFKNLADERALQQFLPSGSGDIPDELRMPEFNNTPKDSDKPKDPDKETGSAISSLESEIANMLKENEEDREKDKYLALAKMGLALMSSSQPTFGGALGEAGMAGLDDLQESRKSYRDDKITLLDAQRKLEQARATAAAKDKSGLTGSNIVSLLNNARTRKSNTLAKIAEEMPTGIEAATPMTPEKLAAIEGLRRDVARLDVEISTYESMLGGIGSLGVDLDATAN